MKGHHMLFKDGKKFISEISQSSSSAQNVVNKEHIQIRYGSLMPLFLINACLSKRATSKQPLSVKLVDISDLLR
jgi:hypothetical protein